MWLAGVWAASVDFNWQVELHDKVGESVRFTENLVLGQAIASKFMDPTHEVSAAALVDAVQHRLNQWWRLSASPVAYVELDQ